MCKYQLFVSFHRSNNSKVIAHSCNTAQRLDFELNLCTISSLLFCIYFMNWYYRLRGWLFFSVSIHNQQYPTITVTLLCYTISNNIEVNFWNPYVDDTCDRESEGKRNLQRGWRGAEWTHASHASNEQEDRGSKELRQSSNQSIPPGWIFLEQFFQPWKQNGQF